MTIKILYEDDDILAIDKPAGMMVHPDGRSEGLTVSDWVSERYPHARAVGEAQKLPDGTTIRRPGIVHRLDRETSGVMLIAKHQSAFEKLKQQFQSHDIKKTYTAIVYGRMPDDHGMIDLPIGRSKADFRKRSAERSARGDMREAQTSYRVLARSVAGEYSLLELYPHTGRTHQIRVHLKALQHPVVCDRLYASRRTCPIVPGRLALHARSIEFDAPTGRHLTIKAPLPEDMATALETIFAKLNAKGVDCSPAL